MHVLEVKNINKFFYEPARFQVLKNVSLQIDAGQFVAVTGKSGSGKSTLLYVLSTMDTDFQGSICIDGKEIGGRSNEWLAAFRNEYIGFVFQFHYLLPDFTALDNVMLPGKKRGKIPAQAVEQKAYELLRQLDVHEQAQKRSSLLSGGQQQRVAIARALINDPLIIMGDEPTGNLDSANASTVFGLFQELSQEKKQTIIIVTHDDELAGKSDRIIHMADGRIAE